ncbi:fibrinogen-like protein 1 [Ruditapes philippinarum]|uniref:fibrinogen-like protein 1 n=1 Tax=Ruditapes philippinarum TaxID=129788 RepID=UPI00295B6BC4|nr:fibrinogen-like protein 1 [Ruditapes philippinarum]
MLFKLLLIYTIIDFTCGQQKVWTDDHVINALGDHGDRIADLEKLVQSLVASQSVLKKELEDLNATNMELSVQLKNITDNCLNFMKCSDLGQDAASTHASTQVVSQSSTGTTTKPQPLTTNSTTTTTFTSTLPTSTATQPNGFQSCSDALSSVTKDNGTFDILVDGGTRVVTVLCQKINGDDWLVIQRRTDGSVDFNRNWQDYKNGFGDFNGEFWLGNEQIHQITSNGVFTLRIEMNDWGGNLRYVQYEHFDVSSESNMYTLTVGSFQGDAGDSFHYHQSELLRHNGMPFSTPDRDNDRSFMNCANKLQSGWWFNSCYSSNLNGKYMSHPYGQRMLGEASGEPTLDGTGIEWYPYRHRQYSMKTSKMMIKQANSGMHFIG